MCLTRITVCELARDDGLKANIDVD